MKKPLVLLVAVVVIGLAAVLLWPSQSQAPAFALKDLNGQAVSQENFKDKVTLLNFWYPSCPGCVSEMPKIIKMAHDYEGKADFQVIGISLPYDPESSVRTYVERYQLPFTVAIDTDGSTGRAYGVQAAPSTFLVDKQGRIYKSYVGEPEFAAVYREVDQLLAQ